MWWTVYETQEGRVIIIQKASALIYARLIIEAGKQDWSFIEAHELDDKIAKRIPKNMQGRPLTMKEAGRLLKKIG